MTLTSFAQVAGARLAAPRPRPSDSTETPLSPLDLLGIVFPKTVRTPALELINEAVVWAERTPGARLIVTMPPQEAKSSLVTRAGSLYMLRQDPTRRIVVASYADQLARRWGRQVRNDILANSGLKGSYDLGLQLTLDARARDEWELTTGGGLFSVGVRGGLTGKAADCVVGATQIVTPDGYVEIRDLDPGNLPRVLSWNHSRARAEWRQVEALRRIPDRTVVEIVTREGRTLRCTPDHRIHTPEGYRSAAILQPGDRITTGYGTPEAGGLLAVPGVRDGAAELRRSVQGVRAAGAAGGDRAHLRRVRGDVQEDDGGARQGGAPGQGRDVLRSVLCDPAEHHGGPVHGLRKATQPGTGSAVGPLPGVHPEHGRGHLRALRRHLHAPDVRAREEAPPRRAALLLQGVRVRLAAYRWAAVRTVREARRSEAWRGQVLRAGVPGSGPRGAARQADAVLPPLRGGVPTEVDPHGVLHAGVRGPGARGADGWAGELALPGRPVLRGMVQADASAHLRPGRECVPGMQDTGRPHSLHAEGEADAAFRAGRAPHRREAVEQHPGEPDPLVQDAPRGASQVGTDTVSVVRVLRGEVHDVYDIQVEGNRNFLAGDILVHNCLIIDDPVKDRKDAESPTLSQDTWEWWESTASTRLSAKAPVILVLTRWAYSDLAGRLMREQPGVWRLLHIPAQADPKIVDPDPLGRAPGEFMLSAQGRTREQWEARKRDAGDQWSALYQGSPVDPGGETFAVDKLAWWTLSTDGRRIQCGPLHPWPLAQCLRFATVDTASSTSSSADYTVASAWAVPPDGTLVLLDTRRERVPEHRQIDLARPLMQKWGLDTLHVEATMAGTRLVRAAVAAGLHVADLKADRSKTVRAALAAQWVDQGRVWFPAPGMAASLPDQVLADVLEEMRQFPSGRHDDFVDTLAYAAAVTMDNYLAPDARPPVPASAASGVVERALGMPASDDLMTRAF